MKSTSYNFFSIIVRLISITTSEAMYKSRFIKFAQLGKYGIGRSYAMDYNSAKKIFGLGNVSGFSEKDLLEFEKYCLNFIQIIMMERNGRRRQQKE